MPLTTPQLHDVQPKKVPKTEAKKKYSQQIVESSSHRALCLLTVCVCSTEIENENPFLFSECSTNME